MTDSRRIEDGDAVMRRSGAGAGPIAGCGRLAVVFAGIAVLALAAGCGPSQSGAGDKTPSAVISDLSPALSPTPSSGPPSFPTRSPSVTAGAGSGRATGDAAAITPETGAGASTGTSTSTSSDIGTSAGAGTPSSPVASAIDGLASSVSARYGSPVTVAYRLTGAGAGIPAADTTVSYPGHSMTVTVDAAGRGSARLSGLPVGTTTVTVRYPGDARHRATSATVRVTVGRLPTEIRTLTVSDSTVATGSPVTVTFDVYSGGKPVTGVDGLVKYGGTSRHVPLDGAGRASVTLTDLPPGDNRIVVSYPGDTTRDGASAPVTVTVTDPDASSPPGPSTGGSDSRCPPAARACVDLTTNTTWLQSGGTVTYGPVPMTSGRPGYRTPAGTFRVYWKDKDHHSSLFGGAPMPNSVFFVGGIAFHEGSLSVPSHGCIHLSWDASQAYWDALSNGDTVVVFGYAQY